MNITKNISVILKIIKEDIIPVLIMWEHLLIFGSITAIITSKYIFTPCNFESIAFVTYIFGLLGIICFCLLFLLNIAYNPNWKEYYKSID